MNTNKYITRPSFLLVALSLVAAMILPSPAAASSATTYPLLPDLPGADISGQARLVIYLDQGIALIDVDGKRYAIGDRPLDVAFEDLDTMTLLVIVPTDTGVFVTEDGLWVDELEPSPVSRTLTYDLVDPLIPFGFELAVPGQPAPTVPDVVIRPTENDPDPA
jgi:hypothetical protein